MWTRLGDLLFEQVVMLHDSWSTGSGSTRRRNWRRTAITYLHVYNKHLRPLVGHRPLGEFELPGTVTQLLTEVRPARHHEMAAQRKDELFHRRPSPRCTAAHSTA